MAKKKKAYELKNRSDEGAYLQAHQDEHTYRKTGVYNTVSKEIAKNGVRYDVTEDSLKQLANDAADYQSKAKERYDSTNYNNASSNYHKTLEEGKKLRDRSAYVRQAMEHDKTLSKSSKDTQKSVDDTLDRIRDTVNNFQRGFGEKSRIYSQYSSADDYDKARTGWLSNPDTESQEYRDTAMDRLQRYSRQQAQLKSSQTNDDKLNARLSELTAQRRDILAGQVSGRSVDGDLNAISQEIDSIKQQLSESKTKGLQSEQKQYEQTQKLSDEGLRYMSNKDFADNSVSKSTNPTREEMNARDQAAYQEIQQNNAVTKNVPLNVPDKLGVFLSANSDDIQQAKNDLTASGGYYDTTWADIVNEGETKRWNYLTDEEKQVYYYKLNTEGQESAYKFLDDMESTLGQRETDQIKQDYDNSSLLKQIAYNAAAVPAGIVGGPLAAVGAAADVISTGHVDPNNRLSLSKNVSDISFSGMGEKIDNATGNVAIPGTSFTLGDTYSAVMSGVSSKVGVGMFGEAYTAIMGFSAAASEANELEAAGASPTQIALGSIAAGIAEWAGEKYSIENFLAIDDIKTMKQFWKAVAKQAGVEASEEVFTELANTLSNAMIMTDKSRMADAYNEGGWESVLSELKDNIVNAALGGAISGGVLGATGATPSYVGYNLNMNRYGNDIKSGGKSTIDDINTAAENLPISKNTRSMMGSDGLTGEESANKTGKVADSIREDTVAAAEKAEIKSILEETGRDSSDAMVEKVYKEMNNSAEISLAPAEIKEIASEIGRSQNFEEAVYERAREMFKKAIGTKSDTETFSEEPSSGMVDNADTNTDTSDTNTDTVPMIEMKEDIPDMVEDTTSVEDIISKYDFDEQTAKVITESYNPEVSRATGVSAADYVDGMNRAYKYGVAGIPKTAMVRDLSGTKLTETQLSSAYKLGALKADADSKLKDTKNVSKFKNRDGHKEGTVKGDGVDIQSLRTRFNDTQNIAYKVLSNYAAATGVDIVLTDSKTDKEGNFLGEQGRYSGNEKTIYIDINAGLTNVKSASDLGKYAMLSTFGHEVVHFAQDLAPVEYNNFKKCVFEEIENAGENVNDLIEEKMEADESLSYEKASNEVVAEALADVLPQSRFAEKLQQKAPKAFEMIRDKLKEFYQNIKDYFSNIGYNRSRESQALKKEIDGELKYLQSIVDMYDELMSTAVGNYQKMYAGDSHETEIKRYASERGYKVELDENADFSEYNPSENDDYRLYEIFDPNGEKVSQIVVQNDDETDWDYIKDAIDYDIKEKEKTNSKPNPTDVRAVHQSPNGYDLYEQYGGRVEVKFPGIPHESIRKALKSIKYTYSGSRGVWYYKSKGNVDISVVSETLDNAYGKLRESNESMENATDEERAEVREAMNHSGMSAMPTQIADTEPKVERSGSIVEETATTVEDTTTNGSDEINSDTKYDKFANQFLRYAGTEPIYAVDDAGRSYVGNRYGLVRASMDLARSHKKTAHKVTGNLEENIRVKKIEENATERIYGNTYDYSPEKVDFDCVLVDNGNERYAFMKRYARFLDNYDFFTSDNPKEPAAIKDTDGTLMGLMCKIRVEDDVDVSKLKPIQFNNFNTEETSNGEQEVNHERTVLQVESNGEGTARLVDERETTDVSGISQTEETASTDHVEREQTARDGMRHDSGRDVTRSGEGSSESRVSESEPVEVTQEEKDEQVRETVEREIEQKSTVLPKGNNFVIGDSLDLPEGDKARYRNNVDCIRILYNLEKEGRYATPEEQTILSKYVGWGGLSQAFGKFAYNRALGKHEMTPYEGWTKEFEELNALIEEGIITKDEYDAMSKSTENAHYTSIEVVKAMYDGLEQMGFNGGRILEPSCGSGNFMGSMPAATRNKVRSCTMVELDKTTSKIAKYLYPNYDVRNEGFQDSNIPNNYIDVAIGNVPFGKSNFIDRNYPDYMTASLHNYFFAKTIDKVRPGGIVMYITSNFTSGSASTKVRKYLMDRANLVGAIKLPNTAFMGNARTRVVTDILIFQKRVPGTTYSGEPFLTSKGSINEYFDSHPEMMLGTVGKGFMYENSITLNPFEDAGPLGDQIREAFKNITAKIEYPSKPTPEHTNQEVKKARKRANKSSYVVNKDGSISQNIDGEMVKQDFDAKKAKVISGLVSIKESYHDLISAIQEGKTEEDIKKARKALNERYDAFVKANGPINRPVNRNLFSADPDCYSIYALEKNYVKTNKSAGIKESVEKADIFFKDTIKPNRTIEHVDSIDDGIIASMNVMGGIDAKYIAGITGMDEKEVQRQLLDSRVAFKDKDGNLLSREQYLSGNVRAKLREAKFLSATDPDYKNNVEELERVIPKDIEFNDIGLSVGSPWVPVDIYETFISDVLAGGKSCGKYAEIEHSETDGSYKVTAKWSISDYYNKQVWGTDKRSFLNIVESLLNSRAIKVNEKDGDGRYVLDKVATAAAQEKAEAIQKEFTRWMWSDDVRREEMSKLYNETFNAFVNPKYDGSNLTVNGMKFTLRQHQADAVQRIIYSGGNTLLAHQVGAGKTLEMAAAAMKLRELGIVKKPVFAVPKSLVAQWGIEFKDYFPASNILVANDKSFDPEHRRTFINMIANGDYDAIIMSYEQFEKVPMSAEYLKEFYQKQIDDVLAAIAERKAAAGKNLSVKQLQAKIDKLERQIAKLTTKEKDVDNVTFESLGIDSLFVDEAHNFKNLQYNTNMTNVSGLGNSDGSQRAFDLYGKVRYLQRLNGGRGIVFATATPVMNSMSEMYIMQKYLQSDLLEELGLKTFDAWAKQFGEVVNTMEIKPSGQGFRPKQSFSKFKNLAELQMLFRDFADVITKVPDLKIPKMKGGKVKVVECKMGKFQKDYMNELEARANNVKNVDPSEDNMLKITSDGRKVSYTQRMIDPSLPYEAGCKIFKCCDNILKEYKASNKIQGTQIVFCDMATPKGTDKSKKDQNPDEVEDEAYDEESAQLYEDMRNYLVKRGIPKKEIAFIHEANTDIKRETLFANVNNGNVRVLIGSTGKMGVGMNAQKRIVAIHHLDAPWRPGDVEQRDGRAFRQKNINDEVSKYVYVTSGSFDSRLWDILDRKQKFINQVMNGDSLGRTAEDTGQVTLSAAEVKAIAAGNPLIEEQVKLYNELDRLNDLKHAHYSEVTKADVTRTQILRSLSYNEKVVRDVREDLKHVVDNYSDGNFKMKIGGNMFTDKKEAGVALAGAILSVGKLERNESVKIGEFCGFDIKVKASISGDDVSPFLSMNGDYFFTAYAEKTTYMVNRIIDMISSLDEIIPEKEENIKRYKLDLKQQEDIINAPFEKEDEYRAKKARYDEIMELLNPKEEQQITDDEDTQKQPRRETLTDREILKMAADSINPDNLTDGEKQALKSFNDRLDKLDSLEQERKEQGAKYKEQQFGKDGDRNAAKETLNRMHILDEKIKRASDDLLSVEDKDVLKSVLRKARKVVEAEERKHGKEKLDRWRARAKESANIKKYRERIDKDVQDLTKWITNPDNKDSLRHVNDALKDSVIEFLLSIDFTSKRSLKGGKPTKNDDLLAKRIQDLKNSMKYIVNVEDMYSGYLDLPNGFMDILQDLVDATSKLSNGEDYVINQMTSEELKKLSKIVRNLKKAIQSMNKFHSNAMYAHISDAGRNTIGTLQVYGDSKNTGKVTEFLFWDQMRPAYAFERFGNGGRAIYDEFRRAQATLAFHADEIINFSKKAYTTEEVNAWENEMKTVKIGDDNVQIPVSYLMGFYELTKQEDSMHHIMGEGIRIATFSKNKARSSKNPLGLGKDKYSDNGHKLTAADVQNMIDALTDRQKEVADKLQKFMAMRGGEWGNYVSIARYGEKQFINPFYYPINSDGRHLESTADESVPNASLYALLNASFTKKREELAGNRIIVYSIFDVFANHMASMAQYNAFALPVLDSLKWLNYQDIETLRDDKGKPTGKINHGSVREEMARVYGTPVEKNGKGSASYAESFVKNIIRAYNGTETQGIPTDSIGFDALHHYNMAQIAYNLRVVAQQPLAVLRAANIIPYGDLRRGIILNKQSMKANIEEMKANSGIAAWKSLGFYDINISRGLTSMIKHDEDLIDKIGEYGMMGAEAADEITWASMWSASKENVKRTTNLRPGSKEFMEKTNEVFEEIIYKTQVVDSVLTKNQFMRSKGFFSKTISSFMSEPVTTASMVSDVIFNYNMDLQNGMSMQKAWIKNKEVIGRTLKVYCVSQIVLAAVQAVVDGFRDDDEKSYPEKYIGAFIGNVIDELLPFNKLPIVSEFYDLAKELLSKVGVDTYGNPPQSVFMQWYDSLAKGVDILYKLISGGDAKGYTYYGGIYKLLQAVSGITGLPMASATREVITFWNNTVGMLAPDRKVKGYESSAEEKYLKFVKPTGLSRTKFDKFYDKQSAIHGDDLDGDGKSDKDSRRNKVLPMIDAMDITVEQKDALYYAAGYGEKRIDETPWH